MSTKCDWLWNNTTPVRIYYDFSDNKVHIETIGEQILSVSDLRELQKAIEDYFKDETIKG